MILLKQYHQLWKQKWDCMDWNDERQWFAISQERERLASDLSALAEHQWRMQSECSAWTVEETLAHLTAAASIGRWRWLRSMSGARFNAELHNRRRLDEHLGDTPAETLQRFRAVITNRVEPSRATWAWLGEVIVHGADIRTALGIPTTPDVDTVTFVAENYAAKDFAVPSCTTARELHLIATDSPFRYGSGPEVTGPVLDIVMVMAGRDAHLQHLNGPGVPILQERLRNG